MESILLSAKQKQKQTVKEKKIPCKISSHVARMRYLAAMHLSDPS
jgi:hypothetical protein